MKNTADSARNRLLEATFQLMEQQGYHGTGLNQIIKESGAPKGSLYYYFPGGKEELVTEAVNTYGGFVIQRMKSVLEEAKNPSEEIYRIFINFAKKMDEMECSRSGSFAAIVLETSNSSEQLRNACKQLYESFCTLYQEMLKRHGFSEDRAHRIATWITSSMEGAVVLCRSKKNTEPLMEIAEEIKIYLQMIEIDIK